MKRLIDIIASLSGLLLLSPILIAFCFAVWLQDFSNPFYIATRSGVNGTSFKMIKLRSMVVNADSSGVDSTSNNDNRITPLGKIIRKFKLDEITQLVNVLLGQMSLVGPRPNVPRETDLYTSEERKLLSVKPGITDISSIVFSDEGKILENSDDPDISYHQLIRPGKSKLGLFYVKNSNVMLDIYLVFLTLLALFNKPASLTFISRLLRRLGASDYLVKLAKRTEPLIPSAPPGSSVIVTSRDGKVD